MKYKLLLRTELNTPLWTLDVDLSNFTSAMVTQGDALCSHYHVTLASFVGRGPLLKQECFGCRLKLDLSWWGRMRSGRFHMVFLIIFKANEHHMSSWVDEGKEKKHLSCEVAEQPNRTSRLMPCWASTEGAGHASLSLAGISKRTNISVLNAHTWLTRFETCSRRG